MPGGTYTLLVHLSEPAAVTFGAVGAPAVGAPGDGEANLAAGWYAYTGSALGSGGFARVDRHHELASGEREVRHWHVDYLLGHPAARIAAVVRSPGADVECAVARAIDGERVPGIGASDCDCDTHLVYGADREPLLRSVETAHERARS